MQHVTGFYTCLGIGTIFSAFAQGQKEDQTSPTQLISLQLSCQIGQQSNRVRAIEADWESVVGALVILGHKVIQYCDFDIIIISIIITYYFFYIRKSP